MIEHELYGELRVAEARKAMAEKEAGTADAIAAECYRLDRVRVKRFKAILVVE
jgi:hypothetical protein